MAEIGTAAMFVGGAAHPTARVAGHVSLPGPLVGAPPSTFVIDTTLDFELRVPEVRPGSVIVPAPAALTPPLVASPARSVVQGIGSGARPTHEKSRSGKTSTEPPSAHPPSRPAPVPSTAAGGGSAATGVGGHVPIGLAALLVLITLIRPAGVRRAVRPAARSVALVTVVERPD